MRDAHTSAAGLTQRLPPPLLAAAPGPARALPGPAPRAAPRGAARAASGTSAPPRLPLWPLQQGPGGHCHCCWRHPCHLPRPLSSPRLQPLHLPLPPPPLPPCPPQRWAAGAIPAARAWRLGPAQPTVGRVLPAAAANGPGTGWVSGPARAAAQPCMQASTERWQCGGCRHKARMQQQNTRTHTSSNGRRCRAPLGFQPA